MRRYIDKYPLLLIILLAGHLVNNAIALGIDTTPMFFDEGHYFELARNFSSNHQLGGFRPPLVYGLLRPFFKWFGSNQDAAAFFIGGLSLVFVVLAVYFLGKELHSRNAGLLSAFIFSFCPMVFGHSRVLLCDLLLTGWLTLAVFWMMRFPELKGFGVKLALGIIMGLGMLTKVAFIIYLIVPATYIYIKSSVKPSLRNALITVAITLGVCGPWYFTHFFDIFEWHRQAGSFLLEKGWYSWFDFQVESLIAMSMFAIGPLWWIILAVLAAPLKNTGFRKNALMLLIFWCVFYCLLYAFFMFKNARYLLPIIPPLCILVSGRILSFQNSRFRKALIAIVILLGLTQVALLTHNASFVKKYFISTFLPAGPEKAKRAEWNRHQYGLIHPWKIDWHTRDISDVLMHSSCQSNDSIVFINAPLSLSSGVRAEMRSVEYVLPDFKHNYMDAYNLCMHRTENKIYQYRDIELQDILSEATSVVVVFPLREEKLLCNSEKRLYKLFRQRLNDYLPPKMIAVKGIGHVYIYGRRCQNIQEVFK